MRTLELVNEISVCVLWQITLFLLLICGFASNILIFVKLSMLKSWGKWHSYIGNFRFILVGIIFIISLLNIWLLYEIHFNKNLQYDDLINYMFEKSIYINYIFKSLKFNLNELSLLFSVLVSFLFPLILILLQYDLSIDRYKYYGYMIWLYCIINIFLYTSDILIFYIMYELMVFLVFYIMYLSANSRGSIEAMLFYLGWASIGSLLVGLSVIYIIVIGNVREFEDIHQIYFTPNERYFLYLFFFFGFGTKLSIWPFWYWLPRAHVEVSTSLSIFLSCVLVKVCFYGLIRVHYLIGGEMIILPFIWFVSLSIFDVTARLIIQIDLKAITAYGSVLHVNLLVLLFLIDSSMLNNGMILYIWGHSYATAGMFLIINFIERCYGTRITTELSGMYQVNSIITIFVLWAIISFLEFPLNFFFWGEIWLWISLVDIVPLVAFIILFISVGIYIIIFFWIWWGVIFGNVTYLSNIVYNSLTYEDIWLWFYIVLIQYFIGMQPHLLCWYTIS